MKKEDVLKLVNAGFTKDEIAKIFNDEPPQVPVQTQAQVPVQTQAQVPVQTQAQVPVQQSVNDFEQALSNSKSFTELATAIADLTKTVKASNIINSNQPPQNIETVDDILQSIFNPKEGGI